VGISNFDRAIAEAKKAYSYSPPTPVLEVLRNYGLDCLECDFDACGLLDIDKKIVYINRNRPVIDKRFSIAMGLGYFLLDGEGCAYDCEPIDDAYCFAAHLLAPPNQVKKRKSTLTISELEGIFLVSSKVLFYVS
jgi:Zn-dependent peptidase ImmA (M78 family)